MNNTGYEILKEKYSRPVNNATGLISFIQKSYLDCLNQQYETEEYIDRLINNQPTEPARSLTLITSYAGSIGGAAIRPIPQPFYEESLELGEYINGLGKLYFCNTRYMLTPDSERWENKDYVLARISRGQMPNLTKKEIEECKQEIASRIKYSEVNVVHNIYGITNQREESTLRLCCCSVHSYFKKYLKENFELLKP